MLKHVETSNQVGNVNLTVCTNLCIVWVRRAERGALPSSLHVLHQQNSLHTLFFAIETAQPHMSGWMVSIAQRQVVNHFVLIARQFDVSRATQDFDPLPRMAAIYGMAELCGVGHRKAARTRPPQLNHGFGTGKERRKMFSFPSFFMTGEIVFSDFPIFHWVSR